jgi:flagellar motor protein MotB
VLSQVVLKKRSKVEGESPFWISFSDLMSALMVLFLVVMAVTLISVIKGVPSPEPPKIQREKDIKELMSMIREESREFPEVKVNESTYRIDLGDVVRFDSGSSEIQMTGAQFLRRYVPVLLKAQATDLGHKWIRRIAVEGFTDQDGTYLFNLGLSLDRSRQVVCVLYAPPTAGERPLNEIQKRQIRELFLVGGYSFNSSKASKEASRRVELRVDFWSVDDDDKKQAPELSQKEYGRC